DAESAQVKGAVPATRATVPAVADMLMPPVACGVGSSWVPPDPRASATRYTPPGGIDPLSGVTCHEPVAAPGWYCTDQPSTLTAASPRLRSSTKSLVYVAPLFPPPP